jgi:hypothetical protein
MAKLSISRAWEESQRVLVHDGRLLASVGLALVAFPSMINTILNPNGITATTPLVLKLVTLVISLLILCGQLALIRLALGPSITVGGAIGHGLKRFPVYALVVLMFFGALVVLAVIAAAVLMASGVPITSSGSNVQVPTNLVTVSIVIVFVATLIFFGVRLMLSLPVASAEPVGPISILRRSWLLTHGQWWPLFGFVLTFAVGAFLLLMAVGSLAGLILRLTLGALQPMSLPMVIFAFVESVVSAGITLLFAVMLARIYAQLAGGAVQTSVPRSGI